METLNLSQTRGYTTGGTVLIIINNQIGFTTSDPLDSRSTLYCTDVAKMVQAPIFHVNGDDPEAVAMVAQIALDFRMEFNKDVVIDLICYRKNGHSEADEPAATQPIMYQHVKNHPGVRKIYTEKLISEGIVTQGEADTLAAKYVDDLSNDVVVSRSSSESSDDRFQTNFSVFAGNDWRHPTNTTISETELKSLAEKFALIPENFELHRSVKKIVGDRQQMAQGSKSAIGGLQRHWLPQVF